MTINWEKFNATTEEDIERQSIEDGIPADIDFSKARRYRTPRSVRLLRERMNLSQPEFAERFGLSLDMVKDWEESGRDIEGPALVLLDVIEREPEAVARAFAHRNVA